MFLDQKELMRPIKSNIDYNNMNAGEIERELTLLGLGINEKESLEELRETLKMRSRTRSLKLWHDHSDILNHSYISFMVSTLYDPWLFITNNEYKEKFPDRPPIDVQATVEKPYLYILGQSKSTDTDQLSYTSSRIEDLKQLSEPIEINGVPFFDVIRAFSGDGPARQFESGQQRGGNFSCLCGIPSNDHSNLESAYSYHPPSLAERYHLYKGGCLWTKFSLQSPSPFNNLKKDEILEELQARNIYMYECNKKELQEALQTVLHGIQRPPALLCTNEIHIDDLAQYEIPACEPLHDITNVVQNLITELPVHFPEKSIQKEFEHFSSTTIGDKNQIRGADSRVFAIKLVKFVSTLFQNGKVSEEILDLCKALVEITGLCYMHFSHRTPRQILRLYNQTFKFSYLCKSVIGVPKKMSARKFYGSHFHSLTVHAPQTNRIFCLRSLIPEQEERSFGDLRNISLHTSNRQCGKVIDNAMLRFNAKQQDNNKMDYTRIQESIVSNQAKFLPPSEDTKFSLDVLKSRPTLFQKHCERIADYLYLGEDQWWSISGPYIVFHDVSSPQSLHEPQLPHLGSITSEKQNQNLKDTWKTCIENFESKKLQLPVWKIKVHADGSLARIIKNEDLITRLDGSLDSRHQYLNQADVPALLCKSSFGSEIVADNENNSSDNTTIDCFEDLCDEDQDLCGEDQDQDLCNKHDEDKNPCGEDQELSGEVHNQELCDEEQNQEGKTGENLNMEPDQQKNPGPLKNHTDNVDKEEVSTTTRMVPDQLSSTDCLEDPCDEDQDLCDEDQDLRGEDQHLCDEGQDQDQNLCDEDQDQELCDEDQKLGAEEQNQEGKVGENLDMEPDQQKHQVKPSKEASVARKKSCKRKLFEDNESSTVNQVKQNKVEKMPADAKQQSSDNFVKKSMAHKLSTLLSVDDPIISQYVKHRKLLKQHPGDTILKKSYEVALTNLQLAVSRKHMELKKRGHSTSLKYAEELMQYWGMYYF